MQQSSAWPIRQGILRLAIPPLPARQSPAASSFMFARRLQAVASFAKRAAAGLKASAELQAGLGAATTSTCLAAEGTSRKLPLGKLSLGVFAAGGLMTVAAPTSAGCTATVAAAPDSKAAAPPQAAGAVPAGAQRHKVVFVLGGPGSGKGTQCDRLVQEFDFKHFSAGDLLREHMKSGSPDGQMVADMIKNGQIVPSHVTISLLQKAMDESGTHKFLIDGFPRNEENRAQFEKQTGILPELVLFFDCPEDVMEARLLGRNQGRTDDNIETIRKRFKVFIDSTMPVVEYYETLDRVARINADRPAEEVYKEVRRLFLEF